MEKPKSKEHIKWDEETIALHDLDRGTRMKIDEPDTPYNHEFEEDKSEEVHDAEDDAVQRQLKKPKSPLQEKEIQWDELEKKLDHVERTGTEPGVVIQQKEDNFKDKRKHHYNEFQRMKEWKEKHALDDDDDDE